MARRRRLRRQVSLAIYLTSALTLVLALVLGGGPEWAGQRLLALAGLLLIVVSMARVSMDRCDPGRLRLMWFLPLALVALPLIQLIPLPGWLWSNLPGRAGLLDDLALAGVNIGGWRPLSLDPAATEEVLWTSIVPIGIFMAAVSMRSSQRRRLVGVAIVFAGLSALVGFWQIMEGSDSALYFYEVTNRGRAVGFFANSNHLASLLAMSLPPLAGMLVDRIRHHKGGVQDLRVWILVAIFVLVAVGVSATVSRAGYLMLGAALAASGMIIWRMRRRAYLPAVKKWLYFGGALSILMVAQFTLSALVSRLDANVVDRTRLYIFAHALDAADPVNGIGWGLGTFLYAYDEIGDEAADVPLWVNAAHNDYLELWADGGLPGLLLALGALLLLARALRRSLIDPDMDEPHKQGGDYRALQLGAGLSLALVAIHSAVDYPLRTLALSTFAALLAAVVVGSVRLAGARA